MFQTTNQMISTTQISISVVQHTQCDTLREWCVNNKNTDKNHQTAVWGSLGRSSTQSGCSIFLKFHSKIPVRVPAILEPHGAGRKPSLSRCWKSPRGSRCQWNPEPCGLMLDGLGAPSRCGQEQHSKHLWLSVLHLSPLNGFPVFPGSPASPSAPGPRSSSSTRYRPVALGQLISPSSQQLRVQLPNQAHPSLQWLRVIFFQTHRITDSEWCLNMIIHF